MNPGNKALAFVVVVAEAVIRTYVLNGLGKWCWFLREERRDVEPHEGYE